MRRGASLDHGLAPSDRVILHVDMDAFYAQVEQMLKPDLRGKPVIVGLGRSRRGVVTACSYEAKAFGVKSGMSGYEALKLCPRAEVVRGSMDTYTYLSEKAREVFGDFTPIVEPASIDEAYLDISGCMTRYSDAVALASALKAEIKRRIALVCSVGVSVNKHLAKISSALEKPDGLTTMWPHELREKLWPLAVSKIYGIGPVTTRTLNGIGVFKIGELAEAPISLLKRHLGSGAEHFKRIANGENVSSVHRHEDLSDEKSISHARTFNYDSDDIEYLHSVILHLSDKVVSRMKKGGFLTRTVSLRVRFSDFTTITRDKSLQKPTEKVETVYETARSLLPLRRVNREKVRLLGVKVTSLSRTESTPQMTLFGDTRSERQIVAANAVEDIRRKFGKESIVRAGSLKFIESG
ncbi:MAG: DNA polymerase IV [candidate division Zixibacteria bacterium]|nr:DNA polymerase IV [candidate division Zixibacteria bacterium]